VTVTTTTLAHTLALASDTLRGLILTGADDATLATAADVLAAAGERYAAAHGWDRTIPLDDLLLAADREIAAGLLPSGIVDPPF
jgi:hypothetical protein